MRRFRRRWRFAAALAIAFGMATAARAATKSLTVSDGICEYRVAYDPAKYERQALKDSLDYLASTTPPMELGPPLNEPDDVKNVDLAQYRADCATHRRALEAPKLIELPGLEDLRKQQLAELDDACQMTEAKLKAATGDVAALASYAPAQSCQRFVDALQAPDAKLRTTYDDLLADLCRTSTERGVCMGHLQREGEKPPREARRRLIILTQGWAECAGQHLLVYKVAAAESGETQSDRAKTALKDKFLKVLHAKTLSCAQ